MPAVFTRANMPFGGAFRSDLGMVDGSSGVDGVLLQQLVITAQRTVNRFYELGRTGRPISVYMMDSPPQGTLQATHIVGPGFAVAAFYRTYGDVCLAGTNRIRCVVGANSCTGVRAFGVQLPINTRTRVIYTAKYCVLTQVTLSATTQDFIVNHAGVLTFADLDYD